MKTKKKHIMFVIPSLAAGGAERIFSFLAQALDKDKLYCTLLVIGSEKDNVYDVSNVDTIYLDKDRISRAVFGIVKVLQNKKPDVVVSSIAHLNTLMAGISLLFPKMKFIAREANVLSVLTQYNNGGFLPKNSVVMAYKRFDKIIAQSKDMMQDMIAHYDVKKEKIVLINNPVTSNFKLKPQQNNTPLRFITIGRLSKEKGHDRLLKVLSKLQFNFEYTIIGSGIEKEAIIELAKSYKLLEHIKFISYTKAVEQELTAHDVFLQGSYSEGFPNVLLESCMVGTPIVAFDAPGGLNEIIEQGKNGYIANTEEEFINLLKELNQSFTFDVKAVRKVVSEKFDTQKILNAYETLFLSL